MIPAARDAAAIEILDAWLAGSPAEVALTRWARASRFAGSKDREAIRDLVFSAIRQRDSALARAGGRDGRALMLGLALNQGALPQGWTGERHVPAPLTEVETARQDAPPPPAEVLRDMPAWIAARIAATPGADVAAICETLRHRAPVHLRVNRAKGDTAAALAALEAEGIEARAITEPLSGTGPIEGAIELTGNARKLRQSQTFLSGLVELQDAQSQALAQVFGAQLPAKARVLDYCAGGGGKALALAAQGFAVGAHDIDPARMADIPARAARAGVRIDRLSPPLPGGWAGVLVDAPCSGSGSWRRAPEAKWALTPARLDELRQIQAQILDRAAALVAPGGVLGYATCSLLADENATQVAAFLDRTPKWRQIHAHQAWPGDRGDGFFLSILSPG